MVIGTIKAFLTLQDEFTRKIDRTAATLESRAKQIERTGQRLASAGARMTTAFTLPLAAAGAAAFKFSNDFRGELVKIETLVGVNRDQVNAWKKDILSLSGQTAKAPKELAQGLFFVTSAGLRGAVAMDTLKASAAGAAIGLGDTATIADAATSAMNAYGAENLSASKAVNILALAVRAGKLEASSLAPVLGRLLPTASAMGVSFEQVAGTLAVMSRTGLDAAEAATSLNSIMVTLLKPTKQGRDALSAVGLEYSALRDLAGKPGGLIEVMRLLNDSFGDNDEELVKVVPNVRALRGVMNVLAQDASVVDNVMREVASGADVLGEGMKRMAEEPGFKLKQAINNLRVAFTDLGDKLAPLMSLIVDGIKALTGAVSGAASVFSSMPKFAQGVVIALGSLLAAIGPVTFIIGQMMQAWSSLILLAPKVAAAAHIIGSGFIYYFGPAGVVVLAIIAVRKLIAQLDRDIAGIVKSTRTEGEQLEVLRRVQRDLTAGKTPTATRDEFAALASGWKRATNEVERLKAKLEEIRGLQWIAKDDPRIKDLESQLKNAEGMAEKFAAAFKAARPEIDKAKRSVTDLGGAAFKLTDDMRSAMDSLADTARQLEGDVASPIEALAMTFVDRGREIMESFFASGGWANPESVSLMKRALADLQTAWVTARNELSISLFGTGGRGGAGVGTGGLGMISLRISEIVAQFEKFKASGFGVTVSHVKALKKGTDELGTTLKEIVKNFYEGMQRAVADVVFRFLDSGKISIGSFWETFKELGFRAIAEIAAKWAATKFATAFSGSGGSSGGGIFGGLLQKFIGTKLGGFLKTAFGFGGAGAASGSAGFAALDAVSFGAAQGVTTTAASSGFNAAAAAGGGALIPVAIFAAGIAIMRKRLADEQKKILFQTASAIELTGGEIRSAYAGRLKKTAKQIVDTLTASLSGAVSALGEGGFFVNALDKITILARNDKKLFEARVGDMMIGRFTSISEATLKAIRYAFFESPEAANLDPLIAQVIRNYSGAAERLGDAITLVNNAINEAGGLDQLSVTIKQVSVSLKRMFDDLISAGLTGLQAQTLVTQIGLRRFEDLWRQLSGEQPSRAELKKEAEARRQLLLAELNLEKIRILQRIEFLKAEKAKVGIEGKLIQVEVETWRGYIRGREIFVKATAKLYDAELQILDQALKAIETLIGRVKVGKIRLGKFGGSIGSAGIGGAIESASSFWETLLGPQSALDPLKKLAAAREHFFAEVAKGSKGDIDGAGRLYLEIAQKVHGSTAAYVEIFKTVMSHMQHFGDINAREAEARAKAIGQLYTLAGAANKAAKSVASLVGGSVATFGSSSAGASSGSLVVSGGGAGAGVIDFGATGIISAIAQGTEATSSGLGTVADEIRRTGKTGGSPGSTNLSPAPPPPPPPTGTTTVFGGGSGGFLERIA